jgi:hypothetical protein
VSAGPLFARYAYPPNALGYCGPPDPKVLVDAGLPGARAEDLISAARRFSGAWPYLELIASSNSIADPLDSRVVEAYWVGSKLLEGIPATSLLDAIGKLPDSSLGGSSELREAAMAGGVAHHSFHVFAVYPWLTLLRSGKQEPAMTVLERCRIRWGRVEAVDGANVIVRSRPLGFDGRDLVLLDERVEQACLSVDGIGFVQDLVQGDLVSLHWDWVCDRLDPDALAYLQHFTARSLQAVNTRAVPG